MKVLITGGCGYIGSTTAKALEVAGHTPVLLDSLLTGPRVFARARAFYEGGVEDRALLRRIFNEHPDIECTVHMAARIVVPESVADPVGYYRDNVVTSLVLFDELVNLGRASVVFSSSASVYAPVAGFEVDESSPVLPLSPYARSKHMIEQILEDMARATSLRAMSLRYFNPIGADPHLESGVYSKEPSHVLGQLTMAALGQRGAFHVTGVDLPTRDGTGLRDYVHVWDLARAHVAAVERFYEVMDSGEPNPVLNVGTGRGVTVRELLHTFEAVFGRSVPTVDAPPRPGDPVGAFANVDRIRDVLGWVAHLTLEDGIRSAIDWAERRGDVLGYP